MTTMIELTPDYAREVLNLVERYAEMERLLAELSDASGIASVHVNISPGERMSVTVHRKGSCHEPPVSHTYAFAMSTSMEALRQEIRRLQMIAEQRLAQLGVIPRGEEV